MSFDWVEAMAGYAMMLLERAMSCSCCRWVSPEERAKRAAAAKAAEEARRRAEVSILAEKAAGQFSMTGHVSQTKCQPACSHTLVQRMDATLGAR